MLGFFRKKTKEEEFRSLIKAGKLRSAIDVGLSILEEERNSLVLNEVVKLLLKTGRKEEAINLLLEHAKDRLDDGFIDSAIALLEKARKLNPFDVRAAKVLAEAYEKKGFAYNALKVLNDIYKYCRQVHDEKCSDIEDLFLSKLEGLLSSAEELKKGNIDGILIYFADLAKDLLEADRCSVFVPNRIRGILWTKIAHGVDRIEIPINRGIAGWVFINGRPAVVEDPYSDGRFAREVDESTGYKTKNIICVPVKHEGETIGVFEAVNKKSGMFDDGDVHILSVLADRAARYLANF